MLSGINYDLSYTEDTRKTAIINNELFRGDVDIAAPQEKRLPESASLQEKDYTFS